MPTLWPIARTLLELAIGGFVTIVLANPSDIMTRKALPMQENEAIYELSMIRDRLHELDKILGQQKSTVGIDGRPIAEKACLELAASVEKAIAVADAIAAQGTRQEKA